jgi:hypothetical protein
MGRPALHAHVRLDRVDIEIITAHFKSKLLTFPGVRFSPRDEAERGRFAAYALSAVSRRAFPRSVQKPQTGLTRLHAGHRLARNTDTRQTHPGLTYYTPVLMPPC